ncbi:1-deoxy-D-xylulose-5-phosphate reductoisomerase [Tuberibacillus calidus]|jgi:1-deoxy-D-xylulose-5-phosphate reductoisomerase|uniref:1-deoxy-D-xylulose-5-phosphate reductoisomerase n=1 Tax=Tuberibacillus calidus TaxID=340097 RepID=UPI0003FDFC13|nr:1-deoxy-D-xylulose-5-phosphate reductoisomerase [Tuberibacillus calidus]
MKNISLLGATGSIGTQTADVVLKHPDLFRVRALSFGENVEKGAELVERLKPELVSVKNQDIKKRLSLRLSTPVRIVTGPEGLLEVAAYPDADIVLNALLGAVGLPPTLAAIEAGKTLAIANKETLVTAGHLVMKKAVDKGVTILPVDSEHSAIFQALKNEKRSQVKRLILTASGGSFRDLTRDQLKDVTVEEALKHPNWSMGAKLTIDSATMMNKGLEVIEAHWLFDMPYEQIEVLIHKESIVHSLVEYDDTSVIAQLGEPDMRVPIQYALSYPDRVESPGAKRLNLWETGVLHFAKVDMDRYRLLKWAYQAAEVGGTALTVLNAANEAAVFAFLNKEIPFLSIESLVYQALEAHEAIADPDLDTIQNVDQQTRAFVRQLIARQ